MAYARAGRRSESLENLMRALDLARAARDRRHEARWLATLGQALWRFEQPQEAMRALNDVVGDPEVKANLKQSLKNITAATETANKIAGNLEKFSRDLQAIGDETTITIKNAQGTIDKAGTHVDDLARKIDERMLQVAKLLSSFQSIAQKIDDGKGTAGALVNDKRLYESLVLTSEQLNEMMKDLNRLVEQWEQEGATFKLR